MEQHGAPAADGLSAWSPLPPRARTFGGQEATLSFVWCSTLAGLLLMGASWAFVLFLDRQQNHPFFSEETWGRTTSFLVDLFGIGSGRTPAFLQADAWARALSLSYDTLAMSVLAAGIAAGGALLTFMFGARNVMFGELAPQRTLLRPLWFVVVRGVWALTRAIPELVWAMLIVFILNPGILPGAVALGLHNFGIVGKLASEVVESLDARPARALRAAGAGTLQVLVYGILPQALPQFLTYVFYRWEVIIRTTLVVGVVAAGGLGPDFRLAMSHFHYTTVALLLGCYLLLVLGVDLVASGMRRLAR